MLPLSVLKAAVGSPVLVELKNGETYNGIVVNCNSLMNIQLKEVICTSKDGDKFWKIPEVFIKGCNLKYLRISDQVLGKVKDDQGHGLRGRGRGRGLRGRGRGRGI